MGLPKSKQLKERGKLSKTASDLAGLTGTEFEISKLKPHPLNAEIYGTKINNEFLDSIKTKGVLTPLLITEEGIIISGHQRYHAAQKLNLNKVPVTVFNSTDEFDIREALVHFNRQRVKTNESIAREYQVLKEVEEERAKQRQQKAGGDRKSEGYQKSVVENFPPAIGEGKSRDIAAAKIGVSSKTAEKASTIVKEIDSLEEKGQQEKAINLREKLNKKSVDSAFKEVTKKTKPPQKKPGPQPSKLQRDITAWARKVPVDKREGFKEKLKQLFVEFGLE